MAPLDRSCMTSYQSAIVSTVLSCTILEIFDVEDYGDLKSRLGITHSENLCTICISLKSTDPGLYFAADTMGLSLHLLLHSNLQKRL